MNAWKDCRVEAQLSRESVEGDCSLLDWLADFSEAKETVPSVSLVSFIFEVAFHPSSYIRKLELKALSSTTYHVFFSLCRVRELARALPLTVCSPYYGGKSLRIAST